MTQGGEKRADYREEDIVRALREAGISPGDDVFVHSNLGFFGKLEGASGARPYFQAFKRAFRTVIGPEGTFAAPTFSFSFCWKREFDKISTPGTCGMFSEELRKDPEALRSEDANFSVAAIGGNAAFYTGETPERSFGPDCFWERFLAKGGKFCNLNFDSASTFVHYVERELDVPYRYDKEFTGVSIVDGVRMGRRFFHYVYDLEKPNHYPVFDRMHAKAKAAGLVRTADLGRGQVVVLKAEDSFAVVRDGLREDPAFMIKGPL